MTSNVMYLKLSPETVTKEFIVAYGYNLLEEYGLDGYTIEWCDTKSTLGTHNSGTQKIRLSSWFFENLEDHRIMFDTMLHEIAHAISPAKKKRVWSRKDGGYVVRRDVHHSGWKRACLAIGALPERVSGTPLKAEALTPKWSLPCKDCGYTYSRNRLSTKLKVGVADERCRCHKCGGVLGLVKNF